jgi:hypothetical protein
MLVRRTFLEAMTFLNPDDRRADFHPLGPWACVGASTFTNLCGSPRSGALRGLRVIGAVIVCEPSTARLDAMSVLVAGSPLFGGFRYLRWTVTES